MRGDERNINPIIRGRNYEAQKIFSDSFNNCFFIILMFFARGVRRGGERELYHGERYLKEYTYFYTRLYKYDEKYEKYSRVYTNWDAVYPGNPDDLKGYDYLRYYKDGKSENEEWNAIFLKGKEYIRAIGETITISMTDMTFDGMLGAVPLSFDNLRPGYAEFKFNLPDEEEEALFIVSYTIEANYCRPNEKSDGGFLLDFWTKPTEIAGKKYKMNFYYLAPLEPGDTDWLDSLAGKVE